MPVLSTPYDEIKYECNIAKYYACITSRDCFLKNHVFFIRVENKSILFTPK